jgi:hypothetical protein
VLAGLGLAALRAIEEFREEYEARHPTGRPHPVLPRIAGDTRTYRVGRLVPLCLPPLFMVGWVFVLVLTVLW